MVKSPIKGVGRRNSKDTVGFTAGALEQTSEGHFVNPIPLTHIRPDHENKRPIITYLTSIADSIIKATHEGKTIFDHLSDQFSSEADKETKTTLNFQELPPGAFFDIEEACQACNENEENIFVEWRELLTLTGSIYLLGYVNTPISVIPDTKKQNQDAYVIESGHRRYLGSIFAGHRNILAMIKGIDGTITPLKKATHRWIENHSQKKLSIWENYCELKSYRDAYFSRWKHYPSNRKVAGDIGLHPKAVDRYHSIIKAEDSNLLTDYFVKSVKSGDLHQYNLIPLVNKGISESLSGDEFDKLVQKTIESQTAKNNKDDSNTDTTGNEQRQDTKDNNSLKAQSKEPKQKLPALKINDINTGKRIIRGLKSEFLELSDVEVSEISSLETIEELLTRLPS